MDTKIEIKGDPFSDNLVMQNERLNISETIKDSSSCKLDVKTLVSDFSSQNEREFLPEKPAMKIEKYSSDHEMDNVEIKEEPWWLETETSTVCDTKDEDFPLLKSRLCMEVVSADISLKSSMPSAEVSEKHTSFYNGKGHAEYKSRKTHVIETQTVVDNLSQQSVLKKHNLIHEGKRPHQCEICSKSFTYLSSFNRHKLIHENKKQYQCINCNKSFNDLSNFKKHTLTHEGMKPQKCKTCDKRFSQLTDLKIHNMIHLGMKPHHCKTCDKRFIRLSDLKRHIMIHEGKKPHRCKTCDKGFSRLSDLKRHNFKHVNKKPYECQICDRSFTRLSSMLRHNFIHQEVKSQS